MTALYALARAVMDSEMARLGHRFVQLFGDILVIGYCRTDTRKEKELAQRRHERDSARGDTFEYSAILKGHCLLAGSTTLDFFAFKASLLRLFREFDESRL